MNLPPQTPDVPPRYRFRLPGDSYRIPTSHVSERHVVPDPLDGGDWTRYRDEPHPFEWSEMRDPMVWVGGFLCFLAIALFLVFTVISGPAT